jgi:acetate---CoA ligase (ADP-forming)
MDLGRLLRPRSIAVVGASERDDSYAGETLLNLRGAGFAGPVWGVHPTRSSAHGYECFPSLSDLPEAPDAVVVGIPAASVPDVLDEAGSLGCGGAVVYGAGFGEVALGVEHEQRLLSVARRHSLPVCGPNGNGIVAVGAGAAMWGDALAPLEAGSVAMVSQSGNVAVNALAGHRALRFHTVVSCGNATVVDPAEWVRELGRDPDVRSVALYLEGDGDGALLCDALAACAEHDVGVAVLKVGESTAGAAAATAHTGALAGDQRVFRALVEEAGAAWAADVHDLLELAKALSVPRRIAGSRLAAPAAAGRIAILTCSGGDSALAADECARLAIQLPPFAPETAARLRDLLPDAATVGNPLDYTALIWGDAERLSDIVVAVGDDPSIDRILVFYDQAADSGRGGSWAAVREGIALGAAASTSPVMISSTLPELLDETSALEFIAAGIPAVAGLRTGLACAAALEKPRADPARLREIAATTRATRPATAAAPASSAASPSLNGRRWLAEHEAKELLRAAGLPTVDGRLVADEDDAVAALSELGGHVAVKLSAPSVQHKADIGALELGLSTEEAVRAAHRRLSELAAGQAGAGAAERGEPGSAEGEHAGILVERMAPAGVELLVSARADAVVPCLVIAVGGAWAELLDDAAIVALPVTADGVESAIRALRAAPLLTGGRGAAALDVTAVARLGAAVGELLVAHRLELLELNPVLVHEHGATAVDAVAAMPVALE